MAIIWCACSGRITAWPVGTEVCLLGRFGRASGETYVAVQTPAHELGHAYHNVNLASRPALLRATPMALAETASIFCDTIMVQAGLESAGDRERLALLNVDLVGPPGGR